jgi:hypothetical protein
MELISTLESLFQHLESFAEQIQEVRSWISSWDRDPRNKTNIKSVDFGMTKRACLTIIVNAQSVYSAIHLIDHAASIEFPEFMANGVGMTASDWISVLDGSKKADRSPVEHQCFVVLAVLRKAEKSVRDFLQNKLEPLILSEELGPQARLAFQHHLFFHREHMKDAFLTLQGVLIHGLDRRSADLPLLVYRIGQLVSIVKSIVLASPGGLEPDGQREEALDISAWAVRHR